MKILQVASSLSDWGGIERYVAYLAEGLTERGHEVVVACPPGSPLDRRVPTRRVSISAGKLKISALPAYLKLIKKERFDIVHVHFSPDFVAAPFAAKRLGAAVVMTRHVALPWSASKVRRYVGRVDRVVPVSEAVRRVLLDSGVPDEKMIVAKAGCPAVVPSSARSETRQALGIPEDATSIGFFGRLAEEKGLNVLVESVAHLPANVRFEVFGRGPLQESLAGQGLHLHGFREDVGDCMAAMDAIVIPSTWEEAFPYSALEAMSAGKAVIASDVGGLPEVVQNGVTGLLFPKGDAHALARACQLVMPTMGEKGREIHAAEYTIEKMAERMERVYLQAK